MQKNKFEFRLKAWIALAYLALSLSLACNALLGTWLVFITIIFVTVLLKYSLRADSRQRKIIQTAAVISCLGLLIIGPMDLNRRIGTWNRMTHLEGPAALSVYDCIGIFSLNLLMAGGGLLAGYPEVAYETMLMSFAGPPERNFHGGFAMQSLKIRKMVQQLVEQGGGTGQVSWPNYNEDHEPRRVSLALNAVSLSVKIRESIIDVTGRVPIRYPEQHNVKVVFGVQPFQITIYENIFSALQDRGWLPTYVAVWNWQVPREVKP